MAAGRGDKRRRIMRLTDNQFATINERPRVGSHSGCTLSDYRTALAEFCGPA